MMGEAMLLGLLLGFSGGQEHWTPKQSRGWWHILIFWRVSGRPPTNDMNTFFKPPSPQNIYEKKNYLQ